jgi:ABC-type sugar transport system permease subunit
VAAAPAPGGDGSSAGGDGSSGGGNEGSSVVGGGVSVAGGGTGSLVAGGGASVAGDGSLVVCGGGASVAAGEEGSSEAGAAAPGRARTRSQASRRRRTENISGYLFLAPWLVGLVVLTVGPMVASLYMSFTDWNIFGGSEWIGAENYSRLLGDQSFQRAVLNTFYYTAMNVPMTIVVSLGLALLLNTKLRGLAFFRTAAFFPYVTSIVAIGMVWNIMFSPDSGPVNQILRGIGIADPPGWMTSEVWAMPAIAVISVWRDMGYYMILFLAGLQTVPRELYEAARIDGANAWGRFWNVTLPGLRPTMFFVVVILFIHSFKLFDLILVMTNGNPRPGTTVISQFIYQKGFVESQFGYASAASVALFVICLVVTGAVFAINQRRSL